MKFVSIADARAKFSEYIEKSSTEAVFINKNGKVCAMIVPVTENDNLEGMAIAANPQLRERLLRAEKRYQEGKALSSDEFWNRVNEPKTKKAKVAKKTGNK
jgi:prevent-host-death family protein